MSDDHALFVRLLLYEALLEDGSTPDEALRESGEMVEELRR